MGEETGVEGSAGGIRGPPGRWKAFRDRAGGLWEEGRGWIAGEGTEVKGRAREAEGREDQRALEAGGGKELAGQGRRSAEEWITVER